MEPTGTLTSAAPEIARPATGETPNTTGNAQDAAPASKRGRIQNLKRYPKGVKPPQLTPGRTGPNKRTFDAEVRKALQERNGESLVALARQLVKDAIDHEEPSVMVAARTQVLSRVWPILKDQQDGAQKVVFEGIRLELSPSGSASVTIAKRTEDTPNSTCEETTRTACSDGPRLNITDTVELGEGQEDPSMSSGA